MNYKIRNRVSLILSVIILVGAVAFTINSIFYFKRVKTNISVQYAYEKEKTYNQIMKSLKDNITNKIRDYAIWDDLYYQLKNKNIIWMKANATEFLYKDKLNNIDLIYVEDRLNQYHEYYGENGKLQLLKKSHFWLNNKLKKSIETDFVFLGNDLYLLAISPITTNNQKHYNGYYVMGRKLSISKLREILTPYLGTELLQINHFQGKKQLSNIYQINDNYFVNVFCAIKNSSKETLDTLNMSFNIISYLRLTNEAFLSMEIILLVIIITILFFIYYYISHVSKGLEELIREVDLIASGDYKHKIKLSRGSIEFKKLSNHINNFAVIINGKMVELKNVSLEMIFVLVRAVEAKDPYTKGHSERVTRYSEIVGRYIGYPDLNKLKTAAILHDIGKISVDESILNKKSSLTDEEYEKIKEHSEIGFNILDKTKTFESIKYIVMQHHERFDGKGYPKGIVGKDIDIAARIIAVADSFDAMTSNRPYRQPMSFNKALKVIEENAGIQFDSEIAENFIKCKDEIYKAMKEYKEDDYLQIFL